MPGEAPESDDDTAGISTVCIILLFNLIKNLTDCLEDDNFQGTRFAIAQERQTAGTIISGEATESDDGEFGSIVELDMKF